MRSNKVVKFTFINIVSMLLIIPGSALTAANRVHPADQCVIEISPDQPSLSRHSLGDTTRPKLIHKAKIKSLQKA